MKISIIIPVYNEEETIKKIIQRIEKVSLPIEKEIIVINDGSFDKTKQTLEKLRERYNFIYLEHQKNQGKGAAIKTGLAVATGDLVIIQDADLEYDPKDYLNLIEPFLQEKAEVVYGSRNISESPFSSKFYSFGGKFLTFMVNLFFGTKMTDINTGYKIFRREVLESLDLKEKRFAFCEEVTCKLIKKGYKIKEVPIHYFPRGFKEGKKIRWWRDGLRGLYVIIKCKMG